MSMIDGQTTMDDANTIWIVERVRDEQYGRSSYAISWHRSRDAAESMATRLQAEFDQASERVWPWHEVIETIFEMREEQELSSQHVWTNCDLEECDFLENPHQHHTWTEPEDHEKAFIEQLTAWWDQESQAWLAFVKNEVLARMADPPRYCQELVSTDTVVHYDCHAVSHDPTVTRAEYARRAATADNS